MPKHTTLYCWCVCFFNKWKARSKSISLATTCMLLLSTCFNSSLFAKLKCMPICFFNREIFFNLPFFLAKQMHFRIFGFTATCASHFNIENNSAGHWLPVSMQSAATLASWESPAECPMPQTKLFSADGAEISTETWFSTVAGATFAIETCSSAASGVMVEIETWCSVGVVGTGISAAAVSVLTWETSWPMLWMVWTHCWQDSWASAYSCWFCGLNCVARSTSNIWHRTVQSNKTETSCVHTMIN